VALHDPLAFEISGFNPACELRPPERRHPCRRFVGKERPPGRVPLLRTVRRRTRRQEFFPAHQTASRNDPTLPEERDETIEARLF
jgi:hypothetical protein